MNMHKNARLTFDRRRESAVALRQWQLAPVVAADRFRVRKATVRKWLGRHVAEGKAGLVDFSLRAGVNSQSTAPTSRGGTPCV